MLLRAAGITVPVDPPRALLALVRELHGPFSPNNARGPRDKVREVLAGAARKPGMGAERVPALLPPALWNDAVFDRAVGAQELAATILADPRASFLYYGLFSLDEATLQFFAAHPALVRQVYRNSAARFAAFGEGVRIAGGRVQVPGGDPAAAAWEEELGASPADPARFITRLLEEGDGQCAELFEALGQLDPAHLAFAIGPSARDLRALVASAGAFGREGKLPFLSWRDVDVPFLLERVGVTADGRLAPPGGVRFWQAAFGEDLAVPAASLDEQVTSPWLVGRFAATPRLRRRMRLDALLFAQRRFAAHLATGASGAGDQQAWIEPVASFGSWQTLFLALEEMGHLEPVDYQGAARAAQAITAGYEPPRASRRLAVFQSSIALVAQCQRAGSLGREAAHALVWNLFRAAGASPDEYGTLVVDTIESLLQKLPAGPGVAGSSDDRLLDGLAGVGARRPGPVIEWEGHLYVVDPAAADRGRLSKLREMQGGPSLDRVLALRAAIARVSDTGSSADRVREAAAAVLAGADGGGEGDARSLFGFDVGSLHEKMHAVARGARDEPAGPRGEGAGRALSEGLEAVLADALVARVYGLWLDPEAPLVAGDSPARRHDFGRGSLPDPGPWGFPRVTGLGTGRGLTGSLLGLDRSLARQVLRSTMVGLPPRPPTLHPEDVRGLGESVLVVNPSRVTDEGAALVAAATRRGRSRLASAAAHPRELEALLASAGVDGIRRRLVLLAAARGPAAVLDDVSLAEVLALGQEGAPLAERVLASWGVAARLADGSLGQWMPRRLAWREREGRPGLGLLSAQLADLHLRVAECLVELQLPAVLARGVLSFATWDLAMTAQTPSPDDWVPVVRAAQALSIERCRDHVSALAAGGPLRRVEPPGK